MIGAQQVSAPRRIRPTRSEANISAVSLNGEVVLVDTDDFMLDGKTLAVVALWEGALALRYPKTGHERSQWAGSRSGFFPDNKPSPGGGTRFIGCTVLGRVISRE